MKIVNKNKIDQQTQQLRNRIVGIDQKVPLLNGKDKVYINFDNAASTPVLKEVLQTVNHFSAWYSSVHRGSGFKSQVASKAYDDARQIVMDFFGANPRDHVVIFGKNSTEALNKLSYRLGFSDGDVVLVGMTEHHSNDLPWRRQATVKHIAVDEHGSLSLNHLKELLDEHGSKVKLVAVSGGSNVTGYMPNLNKLARMVHAAGSQILVDCAQLAPHRKVNIKPLKDPEHIDYIAVSAHKMYAPFGTGALIGRRETFETGAPELCGGGTISVVTEEKVEWAAPPDREEAGSPNVIGAVAFAQAIKCLDQLGMGKIAAHETLLTSHLLNKLKDNSSIQVYGDTNPDNAESRLGVVSLNIKTMHPGLVSAILSTEWGIGVRSGCFCAHPYVIKLLALTDRDIDKFRRAMLGGDRRDVPGMVRISFGMYNTTQEIDTLVDALDQISAGAYEGNYQQDTLTGDYSATGWVPQLAKYYSL